MTDNLESRTGQQQPSLRRELEDIHLSIRKLWVEVRRKQQQSSVPRTALVASYWRMQYDLGSPTTAALDDLRVWEGTPALNIILPLSTPVYVTDQVWEATRLTLTQSVNLALDRGAVDTSVEGTSVTVYVNSEQITHTLLAEHAGTHTWDIGFSGGAGDQIVIVIDPNDDDWLLTSGVTAQLWGHGISGGLVMRPTWEPPV